MKSRIYIRLFYITIACLFALSTEARTYVDIHVGNDSPYVDHLSLQENTTDMDLMVKFMFNESDNSLTVSLISYRSLFVFRENTPYKPTIKGRKISVDRMPYVVEAEEGSRFRLTKDFNKSLFPPHSLTMFKRRKMYKRYVFKRWLDYEGMQAIPADYKMVNDYIEQKFSVAANVNKVKVTLRDVMLMRHAGNNPKKPNRYEIFFGKDLDREYWITIDRDPCFGMEEETTIAQTEMESVKKSYETMKAKYGSGVVKSQESLDVFNKIQGIVKEQFLRKENSSACEDIQQCWTEYNLYVDSITNMQCNLVVAEKNTVAGKGNGGGNGGNSVKGTLPEKDILTVARQIDDMVARWMLTKDPVEKRDISKHCSTLIREAREKIANTSAKTESQKKALTIYREAEQYFITNCVK